MTAKIWSNVFLPIAVFAMAAGIVFFAMTQWRDDKPEAKSQHTIEGIQGLNEGELVILPSLTKLTGETVFLDRLKEEQVLFVFMTPSCSGCSKDVELWRDLNDEASKKGVAFFIVDLGNDRDALDNFTDVHNLRALPILFDPDHRVGATLKINLVPQYLLFDRNGRVRHRWDGVRRYDREAGQKQLAEFFQSDGNLP